MTYVPGFSMCYVLLIEGSSGWSQIHKSFSFKLLFKLLRLWVFVFKKIAGELNWKSTYITEATFPLALNSPFLTYLPDQLIQGLFLNYTMGSQVVKKRGF